MKMVSTLLGFTLTAVAMGVGMGLTAAASAQPTAKATAAQAKRAAARSTPSAASRSTKRATQKSAAARASKSSETSPRAATGSTSGSNFGTAAGKSSGAAAKAAPAAANAAPAAANAAPAAANAAPAAANAAPATPAPELRAPTPPAAPPAGPRTALLDALRQAIDSAPPVGVASARARAQGNEVQRARGKHLPTLAVNSGVGGGSNAQSRGATASLNLWAAGAIDASIAQQRAAFEAGREGVQAACSEALVQASDAYVTVLRNDAQVALLREHVAEYLSIQDMVTQIAAVDTGRRIDVEQVLTRKGLVQLQLLDAQTQARQARMSLSRAVGQGVEPVDASVDPVAGALLPSTAQDAAARAREANPALAGARNELEAARHAVDVARGARWPQLNLVANARRDRVNGVRDRDDTVGLQAQWNLFNGGSDFYAEKSSLEAVAAAQSRVEDVQRQIDFDVGQTWEAIAAARARASQQADQSRPARAVLDANRELFRLGRRSVLDILNAANDVHAVRVAASEARHEAWLRSLRLHVLTGGLMQQLNVSAPSPCAKDAVVLPPTLLDSLTPSR
jgi:outer membrane protein TolC